MATDSFFDISGRVILITGAASGLGLSMSEVFAERGAKLALLDNDTKVGCARDIQGLALFLASAASDFLTGAQIPIDGGAALGVAC